MNNVIRGPVVVISSAIAGEIPRVKGARSDALADCDEMTRAGEARG
jgi:hypothetical protein